MEFRIREILKEKGVTALSLAGRIGMTQANLSNIMTGKTTPSLGALENIATALNVPIGELFDKPSNGSITCPNCGAVLKLNAEIEGR